MNYRNYLSLICCWLLGSGLGLAAETTASTAITNAAESTSNTLAVANGSTNAAPRNSASISESSFSISNGVIANPNPEPRTNNIEIRFQFDGLPYADAVTRFAQMVNKPLIADTKVDGTLTFNDPHPYGYSEALETLNLILSLKGVMLIESGRYLRLIPLKDLQQMPLRVFHGLEQIGDISPGEVVTVVLTLKNLDSAEVAKSVTTMLSSAGSIAPLSRGRGLIITDRLSNIKRVQDLLGAVDTASPDQREMRSYTLVNASGAVLVDMINRTFGIATAPRRVEFNQKTQQYQQLPPDVNDYVTAVWGEATRTLVLFGPADRISLAEALIKRFEDKSEVPAGEVKTYSPQTMSAQELARMVRQALPNVAEERESSATAATKARLVVDTASNRMIVAAPTMTQLEEIDKLVKKLDASAGEGAGAEQRKLKAITLKYTSASSIATMVAQLYSRQARADDPRTRIAATASSDDKTILVEAMVPVLERLEEVVRILDVPPAQGIYEVRTYQITETSASDLAQSLVRLFAERRRPDSTVTPPRFEADPMSNTLIVAATKEQFAQIDQLIRELRASAEVAMEIRTFNLKYSEPEQMAQLLDTMLRDPASVGQGRRGGPGRPAGVLGDAKLRIVSAPALNAVVVQGPPDKLRLAEQLIQTLDKEKPEAASTIRTVQLKKGQADAIAQAVNRTLDSRSQRTQGRRTTVTPVTTSNSLLIDGPSAEVEEVLKIIQDLDQESTSGTLEFHIYRLENGTARDVSRILRQMLDSLTRMQSRMGRASQSIPVTLEIDERANSLIVSATPESFKIVEKLVAALDQAPKRSDRVMNLYTLANADAFELAARLQSMYADRPREEQVVAEADIYSSSLTVLARPQDFPEIEATIRRMDEAAMDNSLQVRLVVVEKITATQMATMLTNIYPQMSASQLKVVDKLPSRPRETNTLRAIPLTTSPGTQTNLTPIAPATSNQESNAFFFPEVVVAVDKTANALLLSGPAHELDRIQSMVRDLTRAASGNDTELRMYALQEADPVMIARTLNDLFRVDQGRGAAAPGGARGTGGGRGTRGGGGGATTPAPATPQPGQPPVPAGLPRITVVAEPRTRSIIVRAQPTDFVLLDSLIKQLDVAGQNAQLAHRLVPLVNVHPDKLLPLLNQMLAEVRTTRPGEPITVVRDPRGNAFFVVARSALLDQIEALIHELDTPASYLEASMMLLSLKNANAPQLATLLQNMLKPGTQGEATLEARELQEQIRRLKVLNDKGEPVVLDLTKPIKIMADPLQAAQGGANRLLLLSTADNLKALAAVAAMMDTVPPMPNIRLFPLRYADAATLQRLLTDLYRGPNHLRPEDRPNVTIDDRTSTLIVSGNDDAFAVVTNLLAQLDKEGVVGPDGVIQTFTLKHADAQRVLTMLRSLIDQGIYRPGITAAGNRRSPRDAIALTADQRSNTLIVSASPENLIVVKELIRQIDSQDYANEGDIRLFQLKHAKASQLATVLEQFFRSKRTGETAAGASDRSIPVTVTPDDRTSTLLVTGSRESFAAIERMIAQLDAQPVISRTVFKVVTLKQATAAKLQSTLTQLFARRPATIRGEQPDPITVVADSWANALVVGASPEDLAMVESLIAQLDNEQEQGMEVQVLALAKADARQVAQTITALYRTGGPGTASPVTINVDERINALVVSAGQNDLKRIAELVKKLDTEQVAQVCEIRIFALTNARAVQLSAILTTILNGRPTSLSGQSPSRQALLQFIARTEEGKELLSSALREGVLIAPDPRANSLVVSAPVEYMKLLQNLISRLDACSPQMATIRVFALRNADARQMMTVLTTLFHLQPSGQTATQTSVNNRTIQYSLPRPPVDETLIPPVEGEAGTSAVVGSAEESALTVSVDLRSNSLLIGGTEHYVALASEIIQTLDASPAQERKSEVYRLKNSRAPDIQAALQNLMRQDTQLITAAEGQQAMAQELLDRQAAIVAETNSNTLLISASPRNFAQLKDLVEQLDQPQRQVLIQVLLAEVSLTKGDDLGVEWTYKSGGNPSINTGTDFGVANLLKNYGGFGTAISGDNFNFLFRALESENRLQVLSRPQILTADNQVATIKVGQQVPIVSASQVIAQNGNSVNNFEYKDVGVTLTVTPRISPDGFVKMDVSPEITQLSSDTVTISPGFQAPIINQRVATTAVSVQSGQSILIGGLIGNVDTSTSKRMPFLSHIPLLGFLFRSDQKSVTRTELLILLTPQVLVHSDVKGTTRSEMSMTREQLDKSAIKETFTRDPMQRQILEPLYPEPRTNAPAAEIPESQPGAKSPKP